MAADKKISELPLFTGDISPADLDDIVDVSSNVTKRIPHSAKVYPYIVLRSTGLDAHRWKITIDDTGVLITEDLGV